MLCTGYSRQQWLNLADYGWGVVTGGQWTTQTALGSPSQWLFTSATANLSSGTTFLSPQINPDPKICILALNFSTIPSHSLKHLLRHLEDISCWYRMIKFFKKFQGW